MNIDGTRRGSLTTSGGVVCSSTGDFEFVFVVQFQHDDILQAELDALSYGLQMCSDRNLTQVEVEID